MNAISTDHLSKSYGKLKAIVDLNIDITEGEIFTLLGANGAGKSTTINLLSTLLQPTSGTASIFGKDLCRNKKDIRQMVSLMPQGYALDPFLTVFDNLRFFAKLEELNEKSWRETAEEILIELEIAGKRKSPVMALSGGQFRRVQIARTLLSKKPLIFIDEPTLGIDVVGKFKVWELIKRYKSQNKWTVVLCTNDIAEAESLADRIAFYQNGKIIKIGTPDEIKMQSSSKQLQIKFNQPLPNIINQLNGYKVEPAGKNSLIIYLDDKTCDIRPILNQAGEFGEIAEINVSKASLVDAFKLLKEANS